MSTIADKRTVWDELREWPHDVPIRGEVTERALQTLADGSPAVDVDGVANAIAPLVARCDWDRYCWQCEQLALETPVHELDRRWERTVAEQQERVRVLSQEMRDEEHEVGELEPRSLRWYEEDAKRQSDLLRRLEVWCGLDAEYLQDIRNAVRASADFREPRRITDIIPDAFEPYQTAEVRSYDHAAHEFLVRLLGGLSPEQRNRPSISGLCGHIIARFIMHGTEQERALVRLRQAIHLAEGRWLETPNDILVIGWLLELALWQQANGIQPHFAVEDLWEPLWEAVGKANVQVLNQLLWLFSRAIGTGWCEMYGWKGLATPEEQHVADLDVTDDDGGKESLAAAVVRMTTELRRWNAETLLAVRDLLREGSVPFCSDLLRANQWIWLAEQFRAERCHLIELGSWESYYEAWECALRAGLREGLDRTVVNACAVLLAGRLTNARGFRDDDDCSVEACLRQLASRQKSSEGARASLIILRCVGFWRQHQSPRLEDVERFEFVHAEGRVDLANLEAIESLLDEDLSAALHESLNRQGFQRAQEEATEMLGQTLWNQLEEQTKSRLRAALFFYRLEGGPEAQACLRTTAIGYLLSAIMSEMHHRLLHVLRTVGDELKSANVEIKLTAGHNPSWGNYCYLFEAISNAPSLLVETCKHIRAAGVHLPGLVTRIAAFKKATNMRNTLSHEKQIPLETGQVFLAQWVEHQLLCEVLQALHHPSA